MSSNGQIIGGVVGAVVGYFVGNPVLGAQIGMTIGGLVDPAKVQGPRLDDLAQQTSTYGAFIPRAYGTIAVHGNVFWIQGDSLIERSAEDSGKGGPTVEEFEYFASFAVSLCEGPIDGIRRIWIGGQLWYDAGSADLATVIASNESSTKFTLYTGTETQEADPLIQADRGAANVPAYRGIAYIVFNELPLNDYGNTLAGTQVKVEVVKSGTLTYILEEYGSATTGRLPVALKKYGDHIYVVNSSAATLEVFNVGNPANPLLVGSVAALTSPSDIAIQDGYAYVSGGANTFRVFSLFDAQHPTLVGSCAAASYSDAVAVENEYAYVVSQNTDQLRVYWVANPYAPELIYSITTGADPMAVAASGGYVYVCTDSANTLEVYSAFSTSILASVPLDAGAHSLTIEGGYAYVTATTSDTLTIFDLANPELPVEVGSISRAWAPVSVSVRDDYAYVATRNNSQLQVFNVYDKTAPFFVGEIVIASSPQACTNDADMVYVVGDSDTMKAYLFADNQITSGTTTLGDIVEAECLKSELLSASDLDVTDLTDTVRGYRISSLGPIRAGVDPLRKAWPFDAVQHGYQIKFKARGGASVATITEAELDAREAGAAPGVQVTNVREMDTLLPDQLTIKYLDSAREYDLNVAEETR